jgi:hypothetical protein
MAANSSAQGFDHLPQFGRPSETALGDFKGEPGFEGYAILAADRAGQTEELLQRKLDAAFRRSDIAVFGELRGAIVRGCDDCVLRACCRACCRAVM